LRSFYFRSDLLFHPALPEKKKLAIDSLGFGTVNKIFFIFEKQWWPNEVTYLLWTSEDIENLQPEEKWMSTIMSFSPVDNAPTVFSVWYYGNKDLGLVENQTDDQVKLSVMKLIRRVFGEEHEVPDPIGMER
jgi:spermine oxidase